MGVYRLKHVNKWCECWRQCYIRWSADRLGRQEPSVTHLKSVTVAQSEPSCLLYSYAPQWAVLSVLTCSDSAGYPPLRLSVYLGLLLYSLSCKMKVSREIKQMTAHDQGQWPCSLLSTLAGTKTLSRTQSSNMWTLDTHMFENTPVTLSTGLCYFCWVTSYHLCTTDNSCGSSLKQARQTPGSNMRYLYLELSRLTDCWFYILTNSSLKR